MRLPQFLPHLKGLRLAEIAVADESVTLQLFATRRTALCPSCRHRSHRVHSRYERTIADLPWSGTTVRLRVRVRRFICRDAACPQRIFAEQLPQLVDRYARRTHRLRHAEADVAHIARTVGVSRETVYRYLRLSGPPARLRLPARRAALDPYLPYLERHWAEGCRNGKRLWREIRELGLAHSYRGVARRAGRRRVGFDLVRQRKLCAA